MEDNNQQRLDQLEQNLTLINTTLTDIRNQQRTMEERLEVRVNRARETQEGLIAQMRDEQRAFQEEMRTSVRALRDLSRTPSQRIRPRRGYGEGPPHEEPGENPHLEEEEEEVGWNPNGAAVLGNWRFKKLDLPLFSGENPDGWIMRAERYFKFHRLTEDEKVEAAVVALEGEALLWFQWEDSRRTITRWEELKGMVLRQFRPKSAGTLHEQWLNHRQTEKMGVAEYKRRFIELLAPLGNIQEEVAKGHFINGLREEVRGSWAQDLWIWPWI